MSCTVELLTGEAQTRRRRLKIPVVETVPVAKSYPNRRRRVMGCRSSKNLTRGLTGRLTCVRSLVAVRNGVGEARELFSVEREGGKVGEGWTGDFKAGWVASGALMAEATTATIAVDTTGT
jgi:hypothetical protein